MIIKPTTLPRLTIQEFCALHSLSIEVVEREDYRLHGLPRYYATLVNTEYRVNESIVGGTLGNGGTTKAAMRSLAKNVSLKTLLVRPRHGAGRFEIFCPKLKVN